MGQLVPRTFHADAWKGARCDFCGVPAKTAHPESRHEEPRQTQLTGQPARQLLCSSQHGRAGKVREPHLTDGTEETEHNGTTCSVGASGWVLVQMIMMMMVIITFCFKGHYWNKSVDGIITLHQCYFPDFYHCTKLRKGVSQFLGIDIRVSCLKLTCKRFRKCTHREW